jgi:ribonuclease E
MGTIRSVESMSLALLRLIGEEARKERTGRVVAQVPVDVATYLMNEKREWLNQIESRDKVSLVIVPNPHMQTPAYTLRRVRDDEKELPENNAVSYQIAEQPALDDSNIGNRDKKPQTEAPLVPSIIPASAAPLVPPPAPEPAPAPVMAVAAPQAGIFVRLWRWLFGSPGSGTVSVEPAVTSPSTRERSSHRERQDRYRSGDRDRGRDRDRDRGRDRDRDARRDGSRDAAREAGRDSRRDGRPRGEGRDVRPEAGARRAEGPRTERPEQAPRAEASGGQRTESAPRSDSQGRNGAEPSRVSESGGERSERGGRGRRRRGRGGRREPEGTGNGQLPLSNGDGEALNGGRAEGNGRADAPAMESPDRAPPPASSPSAPPPAASFVETPRIASPPPEAPPRPATQEKYVVWSSSGDSPRSPDER